jgi:hypothetical protein
MMVIEDVESQAPAQAPCSAPLALVVNTTLFLYELARLLATNTLRRESPDIQSVDSTLTAYTLWALSPDRTCDGNKITYTQTTRAPAQRHTDRFRHDT